MAGRRNSEPFFDLLRSAEHRQNGDEISELASQVDRGRVAALTALLSTYIGANLPLAIDRRNGLADYRTNPYVLYTCAAVMDLDDPTAFSQFLFNNKLYMGLETSFGKSIEATVVGQYPLHPDTQSKWADAPEKVAEFATYKGMSREEKAKKRIDSVWREVDRSCVVGNHRYLTSIKSGPNCINDSQVQAMTRAIIENNERWLKATRKQYPGVTELDVIIGITYGTDRTTNNKENQILVKLLDNGFVEEDRGNKPGTLIDRKTRSVRVYRRIGKDFWASIGNPISPSAAQFVFLEVLLSVAKALSEVIKAGDLETNINARIDALIEGLRQLKFPRQRLPDWIRKDFNDTQLFWFSTAISAFYDRGV